MKLTSLNAYEKIQPTLPMRRREVLLAIESLGGQASIWQVAMNLNSKDHRISGRFGELETMGLIEQTLLRTKHPETGNNCILWSITELGKSMCEKSLKKVQLPTVKPETDHETLIRGEK